jgi:[ribosomal protein S5]-alanine N-acetyltransferase
MTYDIGDARHDVAQELPAVISGPRLDLVLVTVEQLLARDASDTPIPLGYADPHDAIGPDSSPLHFRVAQVREDPSVNPWLIRLAVLRETQEIVGLVNFHGAPDARGMVEIGYRVHPDHRRQGYAREMATTLWSYVATRPDVSWLRATVTPDNIASIAIIEGAGLVHVGEQVDPEDGLELIYEIAAADYRS